MVASGAVVLGMVTVGGLPAGPADASSSPAPAVSSAALPCGINITGVTLRADKLTGGPHRGEWFALGEIAFHVVCPPIAGELDMRLQEFHPREDEWRTVGRAAKKDVSRGHVHRGEHFTLSRFEPCAGNLSWRIRLFVAPGIAEDGTHHGPMILYFPKKAGKQLDCRRHHD